ncbi:MAG: hypothetical protein JWP97_2779 [Labilithrix sp.]|nr:hypothetical protein [Labilithrix sp.]
MRVMPLPRENPAASDHRARASARAKTLRTDHDALVTLTSSVLSRVITGSQEGIADAIGDLQARVLAHLDAEEREVLPGYAEYSPQASSEIMREHATMRSALAELDVAVDLHLVRADALASFLATLRAHAAREDTGLYRWLEETRDT